MRRKDREITQRPALEAIIREADCCHVALVDGDKPYLVALNFGYVPGDPPVLYFHCAPEGRKMDLLRRNPEAYFFVDTGHDLFRGEKACNWGMNFKSVAGTGLLSEVADPGEKRKALDSVMDHYGGTGSHEYEPSEFARTAVLKLTVTGMTGKKKGP